MVTEEEEEEHFVLTLDSSLFIQGSESAFFTELSHESSRLFIVLYFLIIRLSTTQNMMDCRGSQRDQTKEEGGGHFSPCHWSDDATGGHLSHRH
ncbi:hypothetical protein INR49_004942 [Caranx melampygus]|nr:hypothetical protein INR49_004942 [Caranx melampygus]